MANCKKYARSSLGNMFAHYDRSAENGKEHIDWSRTHLNYNLAPDTESKQIDILNHRLSEAKVAKRKDLKVLCTWVVTKPASLPEEKEPEFFKETYKFLENRYGKENVISAYVHKDEVSPHIHFAFVPVVNDSKTGEKKVCAKECVNRLDLQRFHGELQEHLEAKLECQVEILNEATKEGNKAIVELKRESAVQRLEKVHTKAQEMLSSAENAIRATQDTFKPIEAEYRAKQEWLEGFKEKAPKNGITEHNILGFRFNTVSDEKMREITVSQKQAVANEKIISALRKELTEIKDTLTYKQFMKAISDYHKMSKALAVEQQKTQQLQQQLEKYKDRYGEIEEPQQEKPKKTIYKSKSKSKGYDITD